MNKTNSLTLVIVVFLGLLTGSQATGTEVGRDRPSVVLIVVDDLGAFDLGYTGSRFYETPRIDQLADEAVRFTRFYSSHPVCSPTRAAIMTGKYPTAVGITNWIPQPSKVHLPHRETTIAEVFRDAGYRTGFIGKWHLGETDEQLPTGHGFEWQKCVNRAGQPGSYFPPFQRKAKNRIPYWDVPDLDRSSSPSYLTDGLTDHAIEFVQQHRSEQFFLMLSYYAVHTPIQSPPGLVQKYRAKKKKMFAEPGLPSALDEVYGARTRSVQNDPSYAAMVERLDSNVGRLFDALVDLDIADSTLIVFTSDNGGLSTLRKRPGPTSVRPLRAGKGWTYEGGIRVPTFIRWPEKLASRSVKNLAISMDLLPTLLDLTGVGDIPPTVDGLSLAQVCLGQTDRRLDDRPLVWHFPHGHGSGHPPSAAIRLGNLKLIKRLNESKTELYDLTTDPSEVFDISNKRVEDTRRLELQLQIELARQELDSKFLAE